MNQTLWNWFQTWPWSTPLLVLEQNKPSLDCCSCQLFERLPTLHVNSVFEQLLNIKDIFHDAQLQSSHVIKFSSRCLQNLLFAKKAFIYTYRQAQRSRGRQTAVLRYVYRTSSLAIFVKFSSTTLSVYLASCVIPCSETLQLLQFSRGPQVVHFFAIFDRHIGNFSLLVLVLHNYPKF